MSLAILIICLDVVPAFVTYQAELLQADERASRRFIQQTEELRTQLSAEKEAACAHERELAKQR